ncbi:histone-lysine N-methyltransferase SETMAR [Trichonephila clavipes]|nr:histone-lysine N-methyltransferase SETMAR [Trichonephila clavipes]
MSFDMLQEALQEKFWALHKEEAFTFAWTFYCDILSKLKRAVRKKRPELLKPDVLLLDDNARHHSAKATHNHIATLGWKRLYHSPDLAPNNTSVFGFEKEPHMKVLY